MHTVAVSNDMVRISFLLCLLRDAGIAAVLLDQQMSLMEGSAGAIPRRIAVPTDHAARARRVLADAGEA